MKNTIAVGLAVLAAGVVSTGAVHAQSVNTVEKPITIKLGVYFPSSGEVSNEAGNTFFAAGAEYQFGKTVSALPTIPLLYVDYNGRSRSGAHDYSTGVGIGVKQYLGGGPSSNASPYVGAGIGAYFDQANLNSGDENKTNFGYKLDVGYEFDHAWLIEADYQDAGSVAGTRFNGVDLLAGYRF